MPIVMRRGEQLGSSETTFREKREDETWEEYGRYINKSIKSARKRQEKAKGAHEMESETKAPVVRKQSVISESYYERRRAWEKIKTPKKMRDTRGKENE